MARTTPAWMFDVAGAPLGDAPPAVDVELPPSLQPERTRPAITRRMLVAACALRIDAMVTGFHVEVIQTMQPGRHKGSEFTRKVQSLSTVTPLSASTQTGSFAPPPRGGFALSRCKLTTRRRVPQSVVIGRQGAPSN